LSTTVHNAYAANLWDLCNDVAGALAQSIANSQALSTRCLLRRSARTQRNIKPTQHLPSFALRSGLPIPKRSPLKHRRATRGRDDPRISLKPATLPSSKAPRDPSATAAPPPDLHAVQLI
jgi:hypothetical protein